MVRPRWSRSRRRSPTRSRGTRGCSASMAAERCWVVPASSLGGKNSNDIVGWSAAASTSEMLGAGLVVDMGARVGQRPRAGQSRLRPWSTWTLPIRCRPNCARPSAPSWPGSSTPTASHSPGSGRRSASWFGSAHVFTTGGKRLRPAFCCWGYLAAAGGTIVPPHVLRAASSLDLLHVSALIHDDVMDGSDTRRGVPAAHVQLAKSRSRRPSRRSRGLRTGWRDPAGRPAADVVGGAVQRVRCAGCCSRTGATLAGRGAGGGHRRAVPGHHGPEAPAAGCAARPSVGAGTGATGGGVQDCALHRRPALADRRSPWRSWAGTAGSPGTVRLLARSGIPVPRRRARRVRGRGRHRQAGRR